MEEEVEEEEEEEFWMHDWRRNLTSRVFSTVPRPGSSL